MSDKRPSPRFPCGVIVNITQDEKIIMKHDKNGSCEHCTSEAMAKLINQLETKQIIKALKGLSCKHGLPGYSSCYDFCSKELRERETK